MLNFLRNTYAGLRRELTRLAHQPMYFVLMLVLPVVSFAFFALLFNKGVARDIPIAVLDQDHTSLSRKVTQMIDDTATAMVSYGIQDMDEGERLMREGKIMAIVQIPAFFEKNILSDQPDAYRDLHIGNEHHGERPAVERHSDRRDDLFGRHPDPAAHQTGTHRAAGHGAADARAVQQARIVQSLYQLRLLPLAELYAHDAPDLHRHGDGLHHRHGGLRRVRRANGSRRATARYRPHCWGRSCQ